MATAAAKVTKMGLRGIFRLLLGACQSVSPYCTMGITGYFEV
jgi:hypothetical protein